MAAGSFELRLVGDVARHHREMPAIAIRFGLMCSRWALARSHADAHFTSCTAAGKGATSLRRYETVATT